MAVRVPLDPELAPATIGWMRRYKLRGFGSVALHLAYAAIGALDVVLDHKATLWDRCRRRRGAAGGGRHHHRSVRSALFPPAAAAYGGAPMPFLAGNTAAHAEALADCRAVLDGQPAGAR